MVKDIRVYSCRLVTHVTDRWVPGPPLSQGLKPGDVEQTLILSPTLTAEQRLVALSTHGHHQPVM